MAEGGSDAVEEREGLGFEERVVGDGEEDEGRKDEESCCGGRKGVCSSGIGGGRSCLCTHWPSTSFRYPKEATTLAPIANKCLTLTKGSSSKGTLKC